MPGTSLPCSSSPWYTAYRGCWPSAAPHLLSPVALVFQVIAAKAIFSPCRVPLVHLPLHPFWERMSLLGEDELKMELVLFSEPDQFPKSVHEVGEASWEHWEQMCCCGLRCGKGTGVLEMSMLCLAPIQSLSEIVCLPSSASPCLSMVLLAYMGIAFLGKLCHLQKDLGWCPLLRLNARQGVDTVGHWRL